MAEELSKILFNLLETPTRTERYRITGELVYGSYEEQKKRKIDQATAEIKSLLKSKLPNKKKMPPRGFGSPHNPLAREKIGFNSAITEIEKKWEEI